MNQNDRIFSSSLKFNTITSFFKNGCILLFLLILASCAAPRSVINSGKVTTPGQFRVGLNYGFNVASEPLSQLDDIGKAAVDAITNRDSVFYSEQIDLFAGSLAAYAVDPVGSSFDFYIRYGIVPRLDAGYKYAMGAHVFDVMYQFMGSTGTPDNPGAEGLYGSVGLQYAGQSTEFGGGFFLDRINNVLRFSSTRRDITIPIIFSKSFGKEEEAGSIAWGLVYNHAFLDYGFEPGNLFRKINAKQAERIGGLRDKNNFSSYGGFVNARIGYKFIYVVPAITLYYQNYGTYRLLAEQEQSFSGFTFIPSIGLQFRFGDKNR